jgi:hypothetical protein
MGQSEPLYIIEQVIQIKEAMFFGLRRPLTQFPVHFTDIHLGFPCVTTRLLCTRNSDKLAPLPEAGVSPPRLGFKTGRDALASSGSSAT